ncbi:T9SS type A sorting domain-containing protein [bacterium]|nr:T9SS type A sorting domain-containing protein [bacterium]
MDLEVYNLRGQKVQTLVDTKKLDGLCHYLWEPVDLPSGVYFILLKTDTVSEIVKVILMR